MTPAAIVTVVLDGRRIDASHAARLERGIVVGPLDPFVRAMAERIDGDGSGRTFAISRGTRRIVVTIGSRIARVDDRVETLALAPCRRAESTIVPLGAIIRALGGSASYDASRRTLDVEVVPQPIATMTPFATYVPPPPPLPTFEPKATSAPRVTVTGIPRPRRTPILVEPNR